MTQDVLTLVVDQIYLSHTLFHRTKSDIIVDCVVFWDMLIHEKLI